MPNATMDNGGNSSQFMTVRVQYLDDTDPFASTNFPEPTRPPSFTFNLEIPLCEQISGVHRLLKAPHRISDCALQLSNSQIYLDLDSSVSEQRDEFESLLSDGKRNSIILRTQLSVRVHTCIEKLYNCKGRELRRALFSLKQIFQDDKDLVHKFVNADGLTCLIKVGAEADQNYQNYILRALSQIMIYVDGMDGVISHCDTVRWLYSLIASKYRLVVKTSLKLLIVFVEYTESNASLLINAVQFVDAKQGHTLWSNLMVVLGEKDGIDTELLVFAMTLINKTLSNVPDQDTFYDITDALEEQKIDDISQRHINKKGNDLDLVEQFKIYEMALKFEDGDEAKDSLQVKGSTSIKWNRERIKSGQAADRKSRRRNSINTAFGSEGLSSPPPSAGLPDPTQRKSPFEQQRNNRLQSAAPENSVPTEKPWLHRPRRQSLDRFNQSRDDRQASSATNEVPTTNSNNNNASTLVEEKPQQISSFLYGNVTNNNDQQATTPTSYSSAKPPLASGSRIQKRQKRLEEMRQRQSMDDSCSASPDSATRRTNVIRKAPSLDDILESPGAKGDKGEHKFDCDVMSSSRKEQESAALVKPVTRPYTDKLENDKSPTDATGDKSSDVVVVKPPRTSTSLVLQKRREEKRRQLLQQQQEAAAATNGNDDVTTTKRQRSRRRYSQDKIILPPQLLSVEPIREHQDPTPPPTPSVVKQRIAEDPSSNVVETPSSIADRGCEEQDVKTSEVPPSKEVPNPVQLTIPPVTACAADDGKTPDLIPDEKKIVLDMLYANPSIRQRSPSEDSDETNDDSSQTSNTANNINTKTNNDQVKVETNLPTNEKQTADDEKAQVSVASSSVKAMAERLKGQGLDLNKIVKASSSSVDPEIISPESPPVVVVSKKDSDIMWDKLVSQSDQKELRIEGFDFSDVTCLDDVDVFVSPRSSANNLPPGVIPPPPPTLGIPLPPPPPLAGIPPPPPATPPLSRPNKTNSNKKRTVRLFWKEAPSTTPHRTQTVWSEIDDMKIDADKFLGLFELKNKDVSSHKRQNTEKKQEVRVLDVKRSNAINIGLTVLPPPRTIKSAIIAMDERALTKEQIEKLLTMVPTDEEISLIQDAMQESATAPLGTAEQFLLTLSSISEIEARLNLWSFKVDYETLEKEVAEPLQDLRDGITEIKTNKTFRILLSVLRSIGNLLNNSKTKGFDITYLSKVPEVKDTVTKQTLLHHITDCVLEKHPQTTDLYSELGAITRTSRADFNSVEETLKSMEKRCKQSWDHLKIIAKHETKANFRERITDFLMKSAQRIITLKIVHRRLLNRFNSTVLYFGGSAKSAQETNVQNFARMLSEFALEYRTARERLLQKKQKKQDKGERNRTRGKTIIETRKFSATEDQMKQMNMESAILPKSANPSSAEVTVEKRSRTRQTRARSTGVGRNNNHGSHEDMATDPMMEQIVKTATQIPAERRTPVERRKRSRNLQRKSREYIGLIPAGDVVYGVHDQRHEALQTIAALTSESLEKRRLKLNRRSVDFTSGADRCSVHLP